MAQSPYTLVIPHDLNSMLPWDPVVSRRRLMIAHERELGLLTVSTHGFYRQTVEGHVKNPWSWDGVVAMDVLGSGAVQLVLETTEGAWTQLLYADWAELVFVLWCASRYRLHPQYTAGGFIPIGWVERVHAHGWLVPGETHALGQS